MSKVHITLATGDYDRTLPLQLGTVQPEGIVLNHLTMPVEDIFWRMCQHYEFDASELSCGTDTGRTTGLVTWPQGSGRQRYTHGHGVASATADTHDRKGEKQCH